MAAFHLWSRETLIQFAEDAAAALIAKSDEIAELRVQVNRLQVQIQLAQAVPTDTLSPHANTPTLDG